MSKRGYISRYMLLIKRLKTKPYSSFDDLLQDDTLVMGFSKRTLQRDIREIRNLFGVDISYDRARKGYYIQSNEYESSGFQRMIEAFDVFNSLNMTRDLDALVAAEPHRPAGTEHMYGFLHA